MHVVLSFLENLIQLPNFKKKKQELFKVLQPIGLNNTTNMCTFKQSVNFFLHVYLDITSDNIICQATPMITSYLYILYLSCLIYVMSCCQTKDPTLVYKLNLEFFHFSPYQFMLRTGIDKCRHSQLTFPFPEVMITHSLPFTLYILPQSLRFRYLLILRKTIENVELYLS